MIYVLGGGSGKLFAVISVTYPAGSICTCTKGSKVLKAKDTSGKALFNVPEAGDWLVECQTEDGSKKKSKSVKIGGAGEGIAVTLSYTLMLFDNGDQYSENTGGWVFNGSPVPSNTKQLSVSRSFGDSGGNAYEYHSTKNKIDLTPYDTLHATATLQRTQIEVNSDFSDRYGGEEVAATTDTGAKEFVIDISKISGSYYIGATLRMGGGANVSLHYNVKKVWLT